MKRARISKKAKRFINSLLIIAATVTLTACRDTETSETGHTIGDGTVTFSGSLTESNESSSVLYATSGDSDSEVDQMEYISAIPTDGTTDPVVGEINDSGNFEMVLEANTSYIFKLLNEYGLPEKELNFSLTSDASVVSLTEDLNLTLTIDETDRVDISGASVASQTKDNVDADIINTGLITAIQGVLEANPSKGTITQDEDGDYVLTLNLTSSDDITQQAELTICSEADTDTEAGDLNFDETEGVKVTAITATGTVTENYTIDSDEDALNTFIAVEEIAEEVAEAPETAEAAFDDAAIETKKEEISEEREADELLPEGEWSLVWSDEFNGTSIDTSVWTYETGYGDNGWGNGEWQNYTNSSDNSYIEDGNLVIKVKVDGTAAERDGSVTSARMISRDKYEFTYGKVQARVKVPTGQGIWPAFWMLGANYESAGWPECGEIDIMEKIGGSDEKEKTAHGTVHLTGASGSGSLGGSTTISEYLSNDYHVYEVEWYEDLIIWKLDGEEYHRQDMTESNFDSFENSFFLLLNVAVGGNWPGSPDSTTVYPQEMLVDFIRVYQGGNENSEFDYSEITDTDDNGDDNTVTFQLIGSSTDYSVGAEDGSSVSMSAETYNGEEVVAIDYSSMGAWGGGYFAPSEGTAAEDLTSYSDGQIVFTVDYSELSDLTNLGVKVASGIYPDEVGGEINLLSLTPVSTDGNWNTFEVPLANFTSLGSEADYSALTTYLGFWNPNDKTGKIYLKDVYFETDSNGDSGDDDDDTGSIAITFEGGATSATMEIGDTLVIPGPVVTNSDGTTDALAPTAIEWTSSDSSVADVNVAFWMEAYGAGTATITGTYNGISSTLEVTVNGSDDGGDDDDDDNDNSDISGTGLLSYDDFTFPTNTGSTYAVENGVITYTVTELGGQWDNQILNEVSITAEGDYLAKFTASSSVDRDLLFRIDKIGCVGTSGDNIISLTSTPTEYSINVTDVSAIADGKLKIVIALGDLEGDSDTSVPSTVTLTDFYLDLDETSDGSNDDDDDSDDSGDANAPTTLAATPTTDSSNVISLHTSSGTYTNINVGEWNPGWGQAGTLTDATVDGKTVKLLDLQNYQGIDFSGDIQDITGKTTLHMSVWTADGGAFNVFAVNEADSNGGVSTGSLTAGEWNEVEVTVDVSGSANDIKQIKFDGGTGSNYYLDNIYFYGDGSSDSDDSDNDDSSDDDTGGTVSLPVLYTIADGAAHTDITESGWGSGSSLVTLNNTSEGTYANVMEWQMGTGWGGPAVACSYNSLSGLDSYTTFNAKFKYTDTNAASPATFEVQMDGAPTQSVTIYGTDASNWTELSNGWIQISLPLSSFGSLASVNKMVLIVKDDASNPVYFTDIYFE